MALNVAILNLTGIKTHFQNVCFWKFTMHAILSKVPNLKPM